MLSTEKKIGRIVDVAHLYYEENKSQNEIAKELNISRPLVSLLLTEARKTGIVKITINDIRATNDTLSRSIRDRFWLSNVVVVMDRGEPDIKIDEVIAAKAFTECFKKNDLGKTAGIGWGSMLGRMADYAETLENVKLGRGELFPLAGNVQSVIRGYHINELVRVFSMKTGKKANYIESPALFDIEEELAQYKRSEEYEQMFGDWDTMEQAIVSISNFPSYPDLGVKTIYGDKLMKQHAVGRILAYYFDEHGNIIEPQVNTTMQVPFEHLKHTEVTALCSHMVKPEALAGALRLRIIDKLILPFDLANRLMEEV